MIYYDIYLWHLWYIFPIYIKKFVKFYHWKILLKMNQKSNINHLLILKEQKKEELILNQLKNHKIYAIKRCDKKN